MTRKTSLSRGGQLHVPTTENLVVLTAGGILVGYILLLISAGFIGENRLRTALAENAKTDLQKQSGALSYFFLERLSDIALLAEDSALSVYLAKAGTVPAPAHASGADPGRLQDQLTALRRRKTILDQPAYHDIAVAGLDREPLVRSNSAEPLGSATADCEAKPKPSVVVSRGEGERPLVLVCATVYYQQEPVGHVIGDVNLRAALAYLLSGFSGQHKPYLALFGPSGELLSDRQFEPPVSVANAAEPTLKFPVEGTPLILRATPVAAEQYGYLASPWLLGILLLMALPVLVGTYFLLRFNSYNLMLQTRYEAMRTQQEELQINNRRLQQEIAKRVEFERRLAHQANFDELTDLPNRNLALDRLSQAIKRARRSSSKILLMFVDLDHFKQVNDSLGHPAGDKLLREASARLTEIVRESDTVARLGGDEFLLICPGIPNSATAETLAGNVLEALSPPFHVEHQEFFVRASVGLAIYPDDGGTAEHLLKNADVALYRAKDEGRNRFSFFTPAMDAAAKHRLLLESHLRHAIEQNELRLVYQPIVNLVDGRVVALEALMRWHSDTLGEVSPSSFIPLAEDTGIIHDLTRWALAQACAQVATWNHDRGVRVAINISPREFVNPQRLIALVEQCLQEGGVSPERFELELTEGMLVHDHPQTADALDVLHQQGIRLSVDDFGTGYSALSYLQKFPFNTLKVDRSFIQGIETRPASSALVRAILVMAKALGLETVAEGVETESQARFLALHGCRHAQGHLFSAPIAAAQVREFLVSTNLPAV